jgi:ABC-type branched-subunit amino acid transport system permease subunit
MSNKQRWAAVALFLLVVFIIVPATITASGRVDLYYTLTSVALLSIASAGVWLTFYIGRINIGQGAYALVGAYVSALLITKGDISFLVDAATCWRLLRAAGGIDRAAHFALARCVFRHGDAGAHRGKPSDRAGHPFHQRCQRHHFH